MTHCVEMDYKHLLWLYWQERLWLMAAVSRHCYTEAVG